jgi:hypothetical protein
LPALSGDPGEAVRVDRRPEKKKGGPKAAFSNTLARPGGAAAQAVEDVHAPIFGTVID